MYLYIFACVLPVALILIGIIEHFDWFAIVLGIVIGISLIYGLQIYFNIRKLVAEDNVLRIDHPFSKQDIKYEDMSKFQFQFLTYRYRNGTVQQSRNLQIFLKNSNYISFDDEIFSLSQLVSLAQRLEQKGVIGFIPNMFIMNVLELEIRNNGTKNIVKLPLELDSYYNRIRCYDDYIVFLRSKEGTQLSTLDIVFPYHQLETYQLTDKGLRIRLKRNDVKLDEIYLRSSWFEQEDLYRLASVLARHL